MGTTITTTTYTDHTHTSTDDEASTNFDNPSGFSATRTDSHGVEYTDIYFRKIASAVEAEALAGINVNHFYDDMQTVPDWGYYANCTPDQKEKMEYTTYGDKLYVRNITNYHYIFENDLIEEQVFSYMRILHEAGYELYMAFSWGAVYHKDGWYIRLDQNNDQLYHRICIGISDDKLGL